MAFVQPNLRQLAALAAGPFAACQRLAGRGVVALYHRVSPVPDPVYPAITPDLFNEHLDRISRDYRVVPLHDLLGRLRQGLPIGSLCALTFDDGYADFLDFAYPILARRGLHTTHFLSLDGLRTGRPTWNWRLNRVTLARDGNPCDLPLTRRVGRLSSLDREAYLAAEEARLGPLPASPRMLRATDLAAFDPALVEWGSHTVSHANLADQEPVEALRELTESRAGLASVVGQEVRFVAYPNGSHSPEVARFAECAGYEAALAVDQRGAGVNDSMFAVPRFDVWPVSAARLRWELAGTVNQARKLRGHWRTLRDGFAPSPAPAAVRLSEGGLF